MIALDDTITLRQVCQVFNEDLAEEIKILWVLARPTAVVKDGKTLLPRKYAVKEPGKEVRMTNEPGELMRLKDGKFKSRMKITSLLYKVAGDNPELFAFAKHMGQVAALKSSKVGGLSQKDLFERLHSLTPEIYVEVQP